MCPKYYPSFGGVEEHVKNISERLAKDHQVTVFACDPSGKLPREEDVNRVLVRRFKSFSPGDAYHISFEMAKELKKSGFDIVHGHSYHALPLYFARYAKAGRFIVNPYYHGHGHTPIRDFLIKLYKPLGKKIFAHADKIITISEYEKEILAKDFSIQRSEISVIPPGIDLMEFANLDRIHKETKAILYVGRLEHYKGVQHIIEALPLVDKEFCLKIVGKGPYKATLVKLIDRLGLNGRISFHEDLTRQELLKMYATAGLFILLSKYETLSIVVAEALAAKTPCIVANTSALSEWVDNKNCFGLDYPINNPELAELIRKVVGKSVGDVKLWDWDKMVGEVNGVYSLNSGQRPMITKTKDKFGERYFEYESTYSTAVLKGKKPLYHRFWVGYLKGHKRGGKLLDVGCGKGFLLEYAEKFYETYGMDVSEYAVDEARRRLRRTKLCTGDATRLGFDSGYFDIVTCFDLWEHLEDPDLAIRECNRVLAQNGLLIASVPNTEALGRSWKKEMWHGSRDPTHVSLLSGQEWAELARANGFEVIDRFYDGLWDSPYFAGIPTFVQHIFFKFFFTFAFPLLGILGIKLPFKCGENVIFVCLKST